MLRQAVEEAAASRSGECCCLRFWASCICLSSTVAFPCTNVQCLLRQVFACDPELLQDLDSFGSTARSSYLERSVTAQESSVSRGRQPRRVPRRNRRKFHTMPSSLGRVARAPGRVCAVCFAAIFTMAGRGGWSLLLAVLSS